MTYDSSPTSLAPRRFLSARVGRAIRSGQLALFCQPKVNCRTAKVEAVEVLVRWIHPHRGVIAPAEWVPSVESSPLRNRFNLHVIDLALSHHTCWATAGVHLPIAINVTPECLVDEWFLTELEDLLSARRVETATVRLELTERTNDVIGDELATTRARLEPFGVELVLDDFGAGYSSLGRLAGLPFSVVKIDGSLVGGMRSSDRLAAVVRWASHLGNDLGMEVVAEGVEDDDTWRLLQDIGCQRIQGFRVARPFPAGELPEFCASYLPRPPAPFVRRTGRDRRAGHERRSSPVAAS
ncbi:MAG: hypothetical protein QOG68_1763 [Solirubrobacteraceae bacterium]|nr:hypothetical protein [Solirubrobacteraceae bacterium]